MIKIRSFAKINLALAVLGRRRDGYHDIQTVFQTIDLCDELEFRASRQIELCCENLPGVDQRGQPGMESSQPACLVLWREARGIYYFEEKDTCRRRSGRGEQ